MELQITRLQQHWTAGMSGPCKLPDHKTIYRRKQIDAVQQMWSQGDFDKQMQQCTRVTSRA